MNVEQPIFPGAEHYAEALARNTRGAAAYIGFPSARNQTFVFNQPQVADYPVALSNTREGKAFDALASAKVLMSKVAIHLPNEVRKRIFLALDRLHDTEEWEDDDDPVLIGSFQTFLRSFIALSHTKWPSFGLTNKGYFYAIWSSEADRVNLEFIEKDWVKWVLSYHHESGKLLRAAGTAPALEIRKYLSAYQPEHWFGSL